MADKNEDVTLESVFKDLVGQLKDAITSTGDDEPKTEEEIKAAAEAKEKEAAEAKVKEETEAKTKSEAKAKADAEAAAAKGDGEGDEPKFASKADVEAVTAKVASIEQLLTAEDGDFLTTLKGMLETVTTHSEAFEKVIERLERLESSTAVSKSITGDDSGGEEGEETSVEKTEKSALVGLSKAVTDMARHPKGAPIA